MSCALVEEGSEPIHEAILLILPRGVDFTGGKVEGCNGEEIPVDGTSKAPPNGEVRFNVAPGVSEFFHIDARPYCNRLLPAENTDPCASLGGGFLHGEIPAATIVDKCWR